MKISCQSIQKRFGKQIIVQGFNQVFDDNQLYVILGHNGSGKSTLLRILSGIQQADDGKIDWKINDKEISVAHMHHYVSFCAPSFDLPTSLTLKEFFEFHFSFKKIHPSMTIAKIIEELKMSHIINRFLEDFSSGMLQRVKLAQAFFTDAPLLLIDEPASNLDEDGKQLFQKWLTRFKNEKLIILASNEPEEYRQVEEHNHITIADYQK